MSPERELLTQTVGWAVFAGANDGLAHETVTVDTGVAGQEAHRSLCGRFSGPVWNLARPKANRCQQCQDVAAGTPD